MKLGKILPLLCLTLVICLLLLPTQAEAATVSSGTCGDNLTWTLDDTGLLTISGTGAMTDWYGGEAPWYSNKSQIKTVFIEEGVTTIGSYAFERFSSLTISIPDSITVISAGAFSYCTGLKSVTIPDSVTTIGAHAFRNTLITSIIIPDSVTTIGDAAFYDIDTLKSVTIGNGVVSVGLSAFEHCERLTSVTFGNSLTLIPYSAFRMCTKK